MKLADYCHHHGLAPSDLQAKLGLRCRSTVLRWLRGERFPRPAMLRRIVRVTQGHVKSEDFLDHSDPECAERITGDNGQHQLVFPWSNRRRVQQRAFQKMMTEPQEGATMPPPVRAAVAQLAGRVRITGNALRLDGRVVDTRALIKAANDVLDRRGLPRIKYPGLR